MVYTRLPLLSFYLSHPLFLTPPRGSSSLARARVRERKIYEHAQSAPRGAQASIVIRRRAALFLSRPRDSGRSERRFITFERNNKIYTTVCVCCVFTRRICRRVIGFLASRRLMRIAMFESIYILGSRCMYTLNFPKLLKDI